MVDAQQKKVEMSCRIGDGRKDTVDRENIYKWIIRNGDLEVAVTNLGATLLSCKYKGKEMTLNLTEFEDLTNPEKNMYYGVSTGRVAGRISNAKFDLNGKTYELPANNGKNSLHGGTKGIDKRNWNDFDVKEDADDYIVD